MTHYNLKIREEAYSIVSLTPSVCYKIQLTPDENRIKFFIYIGLIGSTVGTLKIISSENILNYNVV